MQPADQPFTAVLRSLANDDGVAREAHLTVIADTLEAERTRPGPHVALRVSAAFEALSGLPEDYASEAKTRALAAIAQHYLDATQPQASIGPSEAALDSAVRVGDPLWVAKTARILGVTRAQLGDFGGAVVAFTEAMEMARTAGNPVEEAFAWNNLGATFLSASHFGDAVSMFERAVALAGRDPDMGKVRRFALGNLALAALQSGDFVKGIRTIQAAAVEVGQPRSASDLLHMVLIESHYARLLLEINHLEEARAHATLMRQYAAHCPLEAAKIHSALAQGLVEVAARQSDVGFSRLQGALQAARQKLVYTLPDVLATIIKAYQISGQPDAALVYWRELERLKQDSATLAVTSQLRRDVPSAVEVDVAAEQTSLSRRQHLRQSLVAHDAVKANFALLERQAVAAELHDDTTGEHCYRVGRLASILAREYGIEDDVCFLIDLAARAHDIGKLGVPDAILLKPGKLTPAEREIMERHTTIGANILAQAKVPQLYVAEEIARHHHERWDGNGYPTKLKGSNIPMAARLTALADVYDALTHPRPYKPAWTVEESLREIAAQRGKHFDPELTDLFLMIVPRLRREHGDLDAFLGVEAKNNEFVAKRAALARALKGEDGAGLHIEDPRR